MSFKIRERIDSVGYALQGLGMFVRTQHNAWIHVAGTVTVLLLIWWREIERVDMLFLLSAVALVWVAEALNTAVEFLADAITQDYNERIKHAKDIAAAAVLIAAFYAVLVAMIVLPAYF